MNTTELAAYKTQRRIGVDKNQRWASKPAEHLAHYRKLFKDHLEKWEYDFQDTQDLLEIFDLQINQANLKKYINISIKDLYILLINDKL